MKAKRMKAKNSSCIICAHICENLNVDSMRPYVLSANDLNVCETLPIFKFVVI